MRRRCQAGVVGRPLSEGAGPGLAAFAAVGGTYRDRVFRPPPLPKKGAPVARHIDRRFLDIGAGFLIGLRADFLGELEADGFAVRGSPSSDL